MGTVFGGRTATSDLRSSRGLRLASSWLPAVIACAVIAGESTPGMSAAHTSHFLRPILERLLGHISDPAWETVHHVIRKGGHFCGYGLVCLTFLRAWLMTFASETGWSEASWRLRSVACAIGSTFVVASCDEIHQWYTPGRQGQFSDVMLDTFGASMMCLLIAVMFRWRTRAAAVIQTYP